ncbi:hypothetical protein ALO79_200154 [Pseudomonas syringae pv. castaneae]|uniref:Uncharacterized protein n=1 Tax=Pseudomonas syringae pv. castaneae TaxID=264450 RepID=A0A0P9PER9_PSESX|nr:hypothetical protein ALO79_200154 [Pseudomonas syringae pv. castaneae]
MQVQLQGVEAFQGLLQTTYIQFFTQNFFSGLGQQEVVGVVLLEYLKEQPAGGLDLPGAFRCAGVAGEYQTGDPGDLAKASKGQLPGVQAGEHIGQQVVGAQERGIQVVRPIQCRGTEQFEAVVVDRNGKGQRFLLADAPSQQASQPQMHLASGKRVQEQVPAFPGLQRFGQQ